MSDATVPAGVEQHPGQPGSTPPDSTLHDSTLHDSTLHDSTAHDSTPHDSTLHAEHHENVPADMVVVTGPGTDPHDHTDNAPPADEETVAQPGKVMRIGSMIKQLLEEVRQAPLDARSRARLREIYETSVKELSTALSSDLRDELNSLALPFGDDEIPSDAELRIAQAQLVGWLEGLFHGIQATLFAQQMAAQAQLQQMRQRGLPPGMSMPGDGNPGQSDSRMSEPRPGTYL